jgi:hypothetical protein
VGSIFKMYCVKKNFYKILAKKSLGRIQLERQRSVGGRLISKQIYGRLIVTVGMDLDRILWRSLRFHNNSMLLEHFRTYRLSGNSLPRTWENSITFHDVTSMFDPCHYYFRSQNIDIFGNTMFHVSTFIFLTESLLKILLLKLKWSVFARDYCSTHIYGLNFSLTSEIRLTNILESFNRRNNEEFAQDNA